MNDWDGNFSRNPAARRSDHLLDDRNITYQAFESEVGASLLRAARDLPKFPEIPFFRSRRAAGFPFERGALDEVNL